jgi:hypothetical protein
MAPEQPHRVRPPPSWSTNSVSTATTLTGSTAHSAAQRYADSRK